MLGHGSRLAEANGEVFSLAALLSKNEGAGFYNAVAFLQGGGPSLEEAVGEAAAAGCTTVYIVPFFLTSGIHIKDDIPQMLERVRQLYPEVELVQCQHLGCDPRLTSLLWDRIKEKMPQNQSQNVTAQASKGV